MSSRSRSEPATGVVKYQWSPKAKPATTTGTLSMPLTGATVVNLGYVEVTTGPAFEFSSELTSGAHSPLTFTGTAVTRYIGGPRCGQKGVKVKKAEVSKSEVGIS